MRLTEAEYAALLKRRSSGKTPPAARRGRQHEDALAFQLDALVIRYQREHRFHPTRKFRFDFALLPLVLRLAVEIDGGVHVIKRQWKSDREKGNLALAAGWRVLHVGKEEIRSGEALALIREALQSPAIVRMSSPA